MVKPTRRERIDPEKLEDALHGRGNDRLVRLTQAALARLPSKELEAVLRPHVDPAKLRPSGNRRSLLQGLQEGRAGHYSLRLVAKALA